MREMAIQALSRTAAAVRRLCTASPSPSPSLSPSSAVAAAAVAAANRRPPFVETNLKPLYHRLSAVGASPGGSVSQTMNQWLEEGKEITDFGVMNMVRELRKYKSYNSALELMDWMQTKGLKMSSSKYAIHLDLLSKVKGIHFARSYFSSLPVSEKNRQTYGALLNSYCRESMAAEAIALYAKMKGLNLASNTLVHNNLMSLYLKLGQPDKVQSLFHEMKANNIPPDNFSYGILISCYGSLRDIDSIKKIIQEMEARGAASDWFIYAQLAAIYNSTGFYEEADSALKMVERIMDGRNRNSFHFLISLYAGLGNLAEVNRVWKSFKTKFKKTTNKSYHVMLAALSKLDDLDALQRCFAEWESAYVNYDIKLVNVMVGAYLRKGMMKEAESLCKKATERGFGSDIRTHELFVDYLVKRHDMDSALKHFDVATSQVKQSAWKPDKEMLRAFLKHFQEVKDVDRAEAFCKSLKKLNCLDGEAYESLLRTYAAAGRKAPLLYKQIKEDGIKMSQESEKLVELVCMTEAVVSGTERDVAGSS